MQDSLKTNVNTKINSVVNKSDLSKHNFKLGNEKVDYTSVFNNTIGKTTELLKDYKVERVQNKNRKSHFVLGTDNNDYETTYKNLIKSANTDNPYQINEKIDKSSLQQTHFLLGSDNNDFKSLNKLNYNKKETSYNETKDYAKQLSSDLKSCHFSLGKQQDAWKSLSQESYVNKEIT